MPGETWRHRTVTANGIRLHFVEEGEGFPIVLLHGFPELWYSWRHQVHPLAAAGLRAVAPDLRGYGGSDKPQAIEDYRLETLAGDVVGLLDALDLEKAVLVGHDWGSIIVWSTAVMHPDRVERVVSLNVPYRGQCSSLPPIDVLEKLGNRVYYILYFQEPGRAETRFGEDLRAHLRRFYDAAAGDPAFLSEEDFTVYLQAFEAGGLSGPINFYRNIDANWEATRPYADRPVECPCMVVMADRDPVLPVALAEGLGRWLPDLRLELVEDCGHWTQQERPQEVNRLLLEFLGDLAR